MLCCCLSALCFVLAAGVAPAQDTSPYLVGAWNESNTWVTVMNPTTKWLTVYAIAYNEGIPFFCAWQDIPPNGLGGGGLPTVFLQGGGEGNFGTVKFFAFPRGTRTFDPNAVIGGFQSKSWEDPYDWADSEANLKAVTINSYTIREFSMIPPGDHPCWKPSKNES